MHGLRSLLREAARQETCGSAESVFAADPPFFPRGFNLLLCESLILLCPSFNYLYKPAEMGIYREYMGVCKFIQIQGLLAKATGQGNIVLGPRLDWSKSRTFSFFLTAGIGSRVLHGIFTGDIAMISREAWVIRWAPAN